MNRFVRACKFFISWILPRRDVRSNLVTEIGLPGGEEAICITCWNQWREDLAQDEEDN